MVDGGETETVTWMSVISNSYGTLAKLRLCLAICDVRWVNNISKCCLDARQKLLPMQKIRAHSMSAPNQHRPRWIYAMPSFSSPPATTNAPSEPLWNFNRKLLTCVVCHHGLLKARCTDTCAQQSFMQSPGFCVPPSSLLAITSTQSNVVEQEPWMQIMFSVERCFVEFTAHGA